MTVNSLANVCGASCLDSVPRAKPDPTLWMLRITPALGLFKCFYHYEIIKENQKLITKALRKHFRY